MDIMEIKRLANDFGNAVSLRRVFRQAYDVPEKQLKLWLLALLAPF